MQRVKIRARKVADIYLFPVTYKRANGNVAEVWVVIDPLCVVFVKELDVEAGYDAFLMLAKALEGTKEVEHVDIEATLRTEGDTTTVTFGDYEFSIRGLVSLGY